MNYAAATTWLKSRSNLPTVMGSAELGVELDAAVKARSFFSAKVAEAHILDKLRDVSDRFSAGTIDRASARAELKTWLSGQGYRANDVAAVPPDGVKFKDWDRNNAITNLASTARLDLILEQNARMAAAVGQYQVGMDPDIAERWPNWRYITGPNPRHEHAKLNGFVAKKSDPVWSKIFPPWAFRCNCSVENCDDEEAAQYGGVKESVNGKIDNNGFVDVSGPSADGFTFNPANAYNSIDTSIIANPELRQAAVQQMKAEFGELLLVQDDGSIQIAPAAQSDQFVTYTRKQLADMSEDQLRALARETAMEYYPKFMSKYNPGKFDTPEKTAAAVDSLLAQKRSKASLVDDIYAMRKRMKNS